MSMRIWTPKSFFQISVAVHVVGIEAAGSEERINARAVGDRRVRREAAVSAMVAFVRRGHRCGPLPQQSSRVRSIARTSKRCSSPASAPPPARPRPLGGDPLPVGTAVVRNIRCPAITGVECPRPGIGSCQRMLLAPHVTGAPPIAIPFLNGATPLRPFAVIVEPRANSTAVVATVIMTTCISREYRKDAVIFRARQGTSCLAFARPSAAPSRLRDRGCLATRRASPAT